MDPILLFLFAFPRARWAEPAMRARYETIHGPLPAPAPGQADPWRSGLSRAYHADRVRATLQAAGNDLPVGSYIRGVLSSPRGELTVRILAEGVDVAGASARRAVDVEATIHMTMAEIYEEARDVAERGLSPPGMDVQSMRVIYGSTGA